jgi:hypothetical protein
MVLIIKSRRIGLLFFPITTESEQWLTAAAVLTLNKVCNQSCDDSIQPEPNQLIFIPYLIHDLTKTKPTYSSILPGVTGSGFANPDCDPCQLKSIISILFLPEVTLRCKNVTLNENVHS